MSTIYFESKGRLIVADILSPAKAEALRTIADWVADLRTQNRRSVAQTRPTFDYKTELAFNVQHQ